MAPPRAQSRGKDELRRVRALLQLDRGKEEEFLGVACASDAYTPVSCVCSRRGNARLWLFRKYIGLEFEEASMAPQAIPIESIYRLSRSRRAFMQKNTFAVAPICHVVLNITTDPDPTEETVVLVFEDRRSGEVVGRALEFLWKYYNEELSERDAMHLTCNHFADVVAVSSLLPLEERCQLAKGPGVAASAEGILRLTAEGLMSFTPQHAREGGEGSVEWRLEDVLLLRRSGTADGVKDHLQVLVKERGEPYRIRVSNAANLGDVEQRSQKAWCLCCNSDVNFRIKNQNVPEGFSASPYRKRRDSHVAFDMRGYAEKVCFPIKDVLNLLNTFQTMDTNQNGMISKTEWVDSLGPLFTNSQVPGIVFGVFDHDRDSVISFPEFLFGCRILHLGSPEDRQVYQFRIFDPENKGHIGRDQFTSVVKLLHEVSPLSLREGEDMDGWCARVFSDMDFNGDGELDINEFTQGLKVNEDFMKAFAYLAQTRKMAQKKAVIVGRLVWFGDVQWLTCTAILMGCKLAVERRQLILEQRGPAPRRAEDFKAYFDEVCCWELGTKRMLQDHAKVDKRKLQQMSDGKPAPKNAPPLVRWESYFYDYAPRVFLALQVAFGADPGQYLQSLGLDQLESSMLVGSLSSLCSMSSSGRSGAVFFASHDGRYVIKSIPEKEGEVLVRVLPAYYNHMMENPNSLLVRYFGLHALEYGGKKITFLVMDNALQPQKDIHVIYDLKGSKQGRSVPVEQRKSGLSLKDQDLKRTIDVPRGLREQLMDQIRKDSELLMNSNLNDYSFLIGIHSSKDPLPPPPHIDPSDSMSMTQASLFRQYYGGFPSRDGREVFYAGIIDLLTWYGPRKEMEHTLKSIRYKSYEVSCVPPNIYRERFVRYIESIFDVSNHGTGAGGSWFGGGRTTSASPDRGQSGLRRTFSLDKAKNQSGLSSNSAGWASETDAFGDDLPGSPKFAAFAQRSPSARGAAGRAR